METGSAMARARHGRFHRCIHDLLCLELRSTRAQVGQPAVQTLGSHILQDRCLFQVRVHPCQRCLVPLIGKYIVITFSEIRIHLHFFIIHVLVVIVAIRPVEICLTNRHAHILLRYVGTSWSNLMVVARSQHRVVEFRLAEALGISEGVLGFDFGHLWILRGVATVHDTSACTSGKAPAGRGYPILIIRIPGLQFRINVGIRHK